ncbi:unnamed protein product [Colias eurytheme]|nr:unnamed protein product [Colias eurytheme]
MYYYKNIAKFFGGSDDNDDSAVPKDNKISAKQSNHLPQNQIYTKNPEKELIPEKETVYENKPKEGFKDRATDMFDEIPSVNGHKGKTYGMDLTGNHGTVWNDLSQTPVGINPTQEPNSVLINSNENKLNNDKGNQGNQPVSNEKIILTPVTDNGVDLGETLVGSDKVGVLSVNTYKPQKKPNEKEPDDFTKKDLDNLLNKKQFWDWLAGWTKKYMDLLNKRLKDMVKQEVANQLQKALHQNPETNNKNNAHGKDNQPKEKPKHENSTTEKPSHHSDDTKKNKEEPSNKSKPKRITEKNNKKDKYSPAEKSSKPKANNSDKPKIKNTSSNSKPEQKSKKPAHKSPASSNEDKEKPSESNGPSNNNNTSVDVHAGTIYGNTVGQHDITNVFVFYNNNGTNGNEGASNNKPANDNSNGNENRKADNSKEEKPSSEESYKKDNDSNEKMKPKSKSFKSKEKPISENKKDKAEKPESNTEPSKEKEHRSDKSEADRRKPEARKEKPKESSESKKAAEPKKSKLTEEKKPSKPEELKSANGKKLSRPKESKRSTENKPLKSKELKPATEKKLSKSKESKPVRNLPNVKRKRNLLDLKNLKYLKKPASKRA